MLRVSLLPLVREAGGGGGGVHVSGGWICWSVCLSLDNCLSVAVDCSDVFSLK